MISVRRALFGLALCLSAAAHGTDAAAPSAGVNFAAFDTKVRPQQDFYRYVNGTWLDQNPIPPFMSTWSTSNELQMRIYSQCRDILEAFAAEPELRDPDQRRLADVYASYMDVQGIDAAGLAPLRPELDRIKTIKSVRDISAMIAYLASIGIAGPLVIDIHPDSEEADRNIADLSQAGLGLPDRDYYLSEEQRFQEIRHQYREHIERVLKLSGDAAAAADSQAVLALEIELARAQWTRVANRDPALTYNRFAVDKLQELGPQLDWGAYLNGAGLKDRVQNVIVSQPSYVTALARLTKTTPVPVWRAYFKFRMLDQLSRYLPSTFYSEWSDFYGAKLSGTTTIRPRWLRAVGMMDESVLGDALGRQYVQKHFPPEAKARAEEILRNLLAAFNSRIDALDWMGPDTKREAHAKLATLNIKFAYPDHWRDNSGLRTFRHDIVGNLRALRSFEYQRQLSKVGQKVDRDEWDMTPQQVNGYYSASRNQVVVAAALMQPPYFHATAENAVNYGGFGWFLAHELTHAFDNRGSRYDAKGNVRDWMTKEDGERFRAKTRVLVDQFGRYEVAPGYPLNGELTLGENIADVSGLAIAHEAYLRSLGGAASPVIDGLTGDQRFFISFATIWAGLGREGDNIARSKTDSHSPSRFRVNGVVVHQDAFYEAFKVRAGDAMYLPPEQRVRIW